MGIEQFEKIWWLVLFVQSFIFAGFCAFIANEKNRGVGAWFILGFLFSFIALIALIAVPKLDKTVDQQGNVTTNTNFMELLESRSVLLAIAIVFIIFLLIVLNIFG